jgi:hypothetical protein
VRAVGDHAELRLVGEMRQRPSGILEQGELRLVVAVGLEQACQLFRGVRGQLLGERDGEELAEMAVVEETRHLGVEPVDAELGGGPAAGCPKDSANSRSGIGVVEVEH